MADGFVARVNYLTFDIFGTVMDLSVSLTGPAGEFLAAHGSAMTDQAFYAEWRERQRIEQYQDNLLMLGHSGYLTHLTELLRERESIDLSRPTVCRILTKAGIGSPRSCRSQQHRFRRRRMPQEGIAGADRRQQPSLAGGPGTEVDAAHRRGRRHRHRGPSGIPHRRGHPRLPDAPGGEGLVRRWEIPLALYSDRHAAFRYNARQKAGAC